jgi:hypothetical protein
VGRGNSAAEDRGVGKGTDRYASGKESEEGMTEEDFEDLAALLGADLGEEDG